MPAPDAPSIVLYNPGVTKPGYQRLPLSLMRLGASLEQRIPYEIVDGNLLRHGAVEAIIDRLPAQAGYLGVTIMPGPQLQRAVPQLQRLKAARPRLTVIAGGYFPSLHAVVCARDPTIDFVVVGPGEETLPRLLETLESRADPADVAGLVFQRDGEVISTGVRPPLRPRLLPPLPYNKVDVEAYVAHTHLGQRTLSHCSSVGCPFRCNFCGVAALSGGQWLDESAEQLEQFTVRLVERWQIDALEFHDHNFFASESRVVRYCEALLRRGIRIGWWGLGRIDTMLAFADETWELLRDSGLRMVFVGAESGDPRALERMNKGGTLTVEKTLQFVARARHYRIVPELSFICGNPPDAREDMRRTIRFVRQVKRVNPLTEIVLYLYDPVPMQGQMWDSARESGFELPRSLEQWLTPFWSTVHRRRTPGMPWLAGDEVQRLKNFETVLNAYYPTSTDRRGGALRRAVLLATSAWRYHLGVYRWPLELQALQQVLSYRRPEISGF